MSACTLLNDFEKKSILNSLKDLGALNAIHFIDGFADGHYVFFFEKNGFVFSESFLFNANAYSDDKPDLQEFTENVRYHIEVKIKLLDNNVFLNDQIDLDNFIDFSSFVGRLVIEEVFNWTNCDLLDSKFSLVSSGLIENECFSMLRNKNSRSSVLRDYFAKVDLLRDGLYDDIVNKVSRKELEF